MLLSKDTLDRIAAGDVDLAFRRWARPTVKTGGTLRTRQGLLEIVSVEVVESDEISDAEARRAGTDLDQLRAFLESKDSGLVYRIELGRIGPDPRVALREDDDLDEGSVAELMGRLRRLDAASSHGPWTEGTLRLLADHPHVRAQDLADRVGLEKVVFKNDVRKLKALGLTISHSPGYELSPRGHALLERLGSSTG